MERLTGAGIKGARAFKLGLLERWQKVIVLGEWHHRVGATGSGWLGLAWSLSKPLFTTNYTISFIGQRVRGVEGITN